MALAPGTRLGNYEIVAAVGAGGMGEVYRSRDPRLNRDVAIKVLSPQLANDPAAVGRFEREAMSVARLSHPNILSIFEFVHQNGSAFVVTEFVEGETLRATISPRARPRRSPAMRPMPCNGLLTAGGSCISRRVGSSSSSTRQHARAR